MGITAANQKKGNRIWSAAGALAFLSMSLVQSFEERILELEDEKYRLESACQRKIQELKKDSNLTEDERFRLAHGNSYAAHNGGETSSLDAVCGNTYQSQLTTRIKELDEKIEETSGKLNQLAVDRIDLDNDIELLYEIEHGSSNEGDEEGQKRASYGGAKTFSRVFREECAEESNGNSAEESNRNSRECTYVLKDGTEATAIAYLLRSHKPLPHHSET